MVYRAGAGARGRRVEAMFELPLQARDCKDAMAVMTCGVRSAVVVSAQTAPIRSSTSAAYFDAVRHATFAVMRNEITRAV